MAKISDRIKTRRKEFGLTQKELASLIGVTHATVSQWETTDTIPAGKNLEALCAALRTSGVWLLQGRGDPNSSVGSKDRENTTFVQSVLVKVPLISWQDIASFVMDSEFDFSNVKSWQFTTSLVSDRAFSVKVNGDTMVNPSGVMPTFPAGCIVIVDPECKQNEGDFVIAIFNNKETTLKKLISDGPSRYLCSLNQNYRPILVDDSCKIAGVVRQIVFDILPDT